MKKTLSVLLAVGLATTALSACSTSGGGSGGGGAGGQGGGDQGGGDQSVELPPVTPLAGPALLTPNEPNGYSVTVGDGQEEETFTFTDSVEIVLGENGGRDAASAAAVQSQLSAARGAAIFAAGTGFGENETPVIEDVYLALSGDPTATAPQNQNIRYVGEYEITTLAIGGEPETSEGRFEADASFATGTGTLTGGFFDGFELDAVNTANLTGTITGSDFTGTVSGQSPEGDAIDLDVQGGFFGDGAETIMGGGTGTVGDAAAAGVFVGDKDPAP